MFDIQFFTTERLNELWLMVFSLVKFAAPGFLIVLAFTFVGLLLKIIVSTFKQASKDDDDDDDFEYKYY